MKCREYNRRIDAADMLLCKGKGTEDRKALSVGGQERKIKKKKLCGSSMYH